MHTMFRNDWAGTKVMPQTLSRPTAKLFPPLKVSHDLIVVNFHPRKSFLNLLNLKRGDNWPCHTLPRKMDMINCCIRYRPSHDSNLQQAQTFVDTKRDHGGQVNNSLLCFSWCSELSKCCFKFHINVNCSLGPPWALNGQILLPWKFHINVNCSLATEPCSLLVSTQTC